MSGDPSNSSMLLAVQKVREMRLHPAPESINTVAVCQSFTSAGSVSSRFTAGGITMVSEVVTVALDSTAVGGDSGAKEREIADEGRRRVIGCGALSGGSGGCLVCGPLVPTSCKGRTSFSATWLVDIDATHVQFVDIESIFLR